MLSIQSSMPTVWRTAMRCEGWRLLRKAIIVQLSRSGVSRSSRPATLPRMPVKKSEFLARRSASRMALSISAAPNAAASGGMPIRRRLRPAHRCRRREGRTPFPSDDCRDNRPGNLGRLPKLLDGFVGRQLRILVEPFRHHQLGGGAIAALAIHLNPRCTNSCTASFTVTAPKRNGVANGIRRSEKLMVFTVSRGAGFEDMSVNQDALQRNAPELSA